MNEAFGWKLVSLSLAVAMVGCVAELEDAVESDEESDQYEGTIAPEAYPVEIDEGVELIRSCECTTIFKRCSSGTAVGRSCTWSDGSGTCPGGYPAVCSPSHLAE